MINIIVLAIWIENHRFIWTENKYHKSTAFDIVQNIGSKLFLTNSLFYTENRIVILYILIYLGLRTLRFDFIIRSTFMIAVI